MQEAMAGTVFDSIILIAFPGVIGQENIALRYSQVPV